MVLAIVDGAMGIMAPSPTRYATVHHYHISAHRCLTSPSASVTLVLHINIRSWILQVIVQLRRVCESRADIELELTDVIPI